MKAAVYIHQTRKSAVSVHMVAMAEGLKRCGVAVSEFSEAPDLSADICAVWGMRKAQRCKDRGFKGPILILERGYLGDRLHTWTSLGWDGLNGHARHNGVWDSDRFNRLFASDLEPWKKKHRGTALIMGQVLGDMSLVGVDIIQWYKKLAVSLWKEGWDVKFRPHPVSDKKGHPRPRIPFANLSEGALSEALEEAAFVCAFNSNSLVDAVMAGVPIYAGDRGSMVYELASRDLSPIFPARESRLNEIANVQWTLDEISSGKAWDIVKEAM